MELSWIAPWLHGIVSEQEASQIAVVYGLALVGLASFAFIRITSAFSMNRSARLVGSLVVLIIFLPGVLSRILFPFEAMGFFTALSRTAGAIRSEESLIPGEFLVFLGIIFVWLRAIRWAAADALPSEVLGRFKLGFIMLTLFVFIFTWTGRGEIGAFTIFFFLSAWTALGSARLARAEIQPAAGKDFFSLHWLLIFLLGMLIGASILALMGFGINAQFDMIQELFLSIWLSLWGLIILLLSPLIIAIAWVFQYLLSRINQTALAEILQSQQAETSEEAFEELSSTAPPPFLQSLIDWLNSLQIAEWISALRPVLLWGILAGMVLIGLVYAGRRTNFWKAVSDDVHLEIDTEEGDEWWRSLAANLRKRFVELRNSLARFADPSVGRKLLAAARIRRVYSFLMDLSGELGRPRREAQTPQEYIPTLHKLFPHHTKDVDVISKAYMRVRYGELDETPIDVIQVDRAWLQLRQEGEHIKKKRKKKKLEEKKAES